LKGSKCDDKQHRLSATVTCQFTVFYTFSGDQFGELYESVIKEFPHHAFVLEDREKNLEQLRDLIYNTRKEGAANFF